MKCEVIKETVSARKDQHSLPWDLNPDERPFSALRGGQEEEEEGVKPEEVLDSLIIVSVSE